MQRRADILVHRTSTYEAHIDPDRGVADVRALAGDLTMRLGLIVEVDTPTPSGPGPVRVLGSAAEVRDDGTLELEIALADRRWEAASVTATFGPDAIAVRASVSGAGERIAGVRALVDAGGAPTAAPGARLYVPRFDWFEAQVRRDPDARERLGVQQWLSPPPLVYVLEGGGAAAWVAAAARVDELDFVSMDWEHGAIALTYEGHRRVHGTFTTPPIVVGLAPDGGNAAVRDAVEWQRDRGILPRVEEKEIPAWWAEPIFCGWGQMRHDYRGDHQGHENGTFINVTSYCTELRYRNYMAALEARGVEPGTVVIDMGWAAEPALARPHPHRWSDMRGFIDEQHARGRRVLLWFAPSVAEGLPLDACMTLAGRAVAPDPTSPVYQAILNEQIRLMLSSEPGCLDADGFKIDFTQCYPSEDGTFTSAVPNFAGLINDSDERYLYPPLSAGRGASIETHAERWGIGLVRDHIGLIHRRMKEVKLDAALMTHTANPAFADVVDILRLNDLDGDCEDVLGVMRNRAELASISCEHWLIDTDDDLMIDKERWLAYARLQPSLGIPDSYYVSAIAQSGEELTAEDWSEVRQIWSDYRARRAATLAAAAPTGG